MAYLEMIQLALRSAVAKPVTSRYPFGPRRMLPRSRGRVEFAKESCLYCNVCAKRCPTDALLVNRKEKQWIIDRFRCITCGACVEICPKKSLTMAADHQQPATQRGTETH